jgi:hypothetical protein
MYLLKDHLLQQFIRTKNTAYGLLFV